MLFHISEEPGIRRFDPRSLPGESEPLVWAIDAAHLRNYLFPRDCPRVTYYAAADSTCEDIERFLGSSTAVVAVESAWLDRIRDCRLYCYELPSAGFECIDEVAGYYVTRLAIEPAHVHVYDDALAELVRRDVEFRCVPNLWHLHDSVAASTLRFSMIRMRNAHPRVA